MISFKNNQNVQPLFDYYLETDLDSFDDQPVDYSKKYADQDSHSYYRGTKSILKTNEFCTEEPQNVKQSCNDEVKVYCIEGTPLTISSASSFCDLREVGTNNTAEKFDMKRKFSSINDGGSPESFEVDNEKNIESPSNKKEETSPSKEKDDIKEGKSVSFRSSNDISKASSPLMFSRSSSIASLNSFEQQSIIDDRSSVSVFSALTSGLISPSDLPDSPGEVMSPALTDKAISRKVDISKMDCNNECDNIGFSDKGKIDPETADNQISDHAQLPQTKDYIPLDSYKSNRNSEDDNEILMEHLEVSNDSLDIDEVFDSPDYEANSFTLQNEEDINNDLPKSDVESDEDDDILLQHCIQLGMPNNSTDNQNDMKSASMHNKMDFQLQSQDISVPQVEINKEVVLLDTSIDESDRKENVLKCDKEVLLDTLDAIKSVDDSDEDDELLQRCIQLGMPEIKPESSEEFVKNQYISHPSCYSSGNDLYNAPCAKSDDDSDEDDILLQQCIQLGMPNESPKDKASGLRYERMKSPSLSIQADTSKQIQIIDKSGSNEPVHSNRNDVIPLPCLQNIVPCKLNEKTSESSKTMGVTKYTSGIKNIQKPVPRKLFPMNTDVDSDGDETDVLLQHCIQMGMPKGSFEKKRLDLEVFRSSEYISHPVNNHPTNDLRDDCPDGISDGDEEDDLLAKCILAGMPSMPTNSIQDKMFLTQTGSTFRKLQMHNHPFLSETSSKLNRKFCHPKLPQNQPYAPVHSSTTWLSSTSFIDVDSMRIYRTEDTPILSPSASISDLSSLSFNESFLNNSRNSDCSSESDDDDELLLRCIRSGMPEAKRAVA